MLCSINHHAKKVYCVVEVHLATLRNSAPCGQKWRASYSGHFNHLNAELNPICYLPALLGAHHIFHVSGLRVNQGKERHTVAITQIADRAQEPGGTLIRRKRPLVPARNQIPILCCPVRRNRLSYPGISRKNHRCYYTAYSKHEMNAKNIYISLHTSALNTQKPKG